MQKIALLNLCVNARDAMPDGGWLVITTEELVLSAADVTNTEDAQPGRYAAIVVSETGIGMTPEMAAHVFEPFFTTEPQGQGTGLGLSQIYGFIRQSGASSNSKPRRARAPSSGFASHSMH
jgi:signal transduction histidine kinase